MPRKFVRNTPAHLILFFFYPIQKACIVSWAMYGPRQWGLSETCMGAMNIETNIHHCKVFHLAKNKYYPLSTPVLINSSELFYYLDKNSTVCKKNSVIDLNMHSWFLKWKARIFIQKIWYTNFKFFCLIAAWWEHRRRLFLTTIWEHD